MDTPAAAAAAQEKPYQLRPSRRLLQLQGDGGGSSAVRSSRRLLQLYGDGGGDGAEERPYDRKQKSLRLLCSNFVALYDNKGVETVGLDNATAHLRVGRRRIYDIVNVLESVGMLVRRAKNEYTWIGFQGIPAALKEIKEKALGEMTPPPQEPSATNVSDDEEDKSDDSDWDAEREKPDRRRCQLRSDHRKEKSLGRLTQNFVKLFLTTKIETISLDEVACLLLGEVQAEGNMRAKVRRLYDIANVLSSLKLIEKKTQEDTRKPTIRWLGPSKQNERNDVTVDLLPTRKTLSSKRSLSTDIPRSRLKTYENPQEQAKSSGFLFGASHPTGSKKQELDNHIREKERKSIKDWESLATTHRPRYKNQAVNDLFGNYVEVWKSWHSEFMRGTPSDP